MVEDLSQPISESYFHLSQDNESDISNTSSIEFDDDNFNPIDQEVPEDVKQDTSLLIRFAQEIDTNTNKESNTDASSTPTNYDQLQPKREAKREDYDDTDNNETKHEIYDKQAKDQLSPKKFSGLGGAPQKIASPAPMISSHSTPLMARKGVNNMKWSKYSKDHFLPDINESRDDTTANDIVRPAHSRNLSKHSRMNSYNRDEDTFIQQPKISMQELVDGVLPVFSEQITEKVRDSINELIRHGALERRKTCNELQKPERRHRKSGDLFITPIRSHTESISNSTSDDDLSLTGIHSGPSNERKKFSVNHDGSIHTHEIRQEKKEKKEMDSPVTTPPHSQEFSEAKAQVNNILEEVPAHDPEMEREMERLRLENLDLKIELNGLHVEIAQKNKLLQEKQTLEIDADFPRDEFSAHNTRERELQETVDRLNRELQRAKTEKDEAANELAWIKSQNDKSDKKSDMGVQVSDTHEHARSQKNVEQAQAQAAELQALVQSLQSEIGDKARSITMERVDSRFHSQYQKLQLHRVDELSKVELANTLKNVMLSLLISDLEHLPSQAAKYGKFLKMTIQFMDDIHRTVYRPGDLKPSDYLRMQDAGALECLGECLDGMVGAIGPPGSRQGSHSERPAAAASKSQGWSQG